MRINGIVLCILFVCVSMCFIFSVCNYVKLGKCLDIFQVKVDLNKIGPLLYKNFSIFTQEFPVYLPEKLGPV